MCHTGPVRQKQKPRKRFDGAGLGEPGNLIRNPGMNNQEIKQPTQAPSKDSQGFGHAIHFGLLCPVATPDPYSLPELYLRIQQRSFGLHNNFRNHSLAPKEKGRAWQPL
jgi:hypothetical protein